MESKQKVLFLAQFPPPIHGASMMNSYIANSEFVRASFECDFFNISAANSLVDVGKFSFFKSFKFFIKYFLLLKKLVLKRPNLVYVTLSPYGFAFLKDSFFILIVKLFNIKIIFHLHGKGIQDVVSQNSFKRNFYKFIFRHVDVIHLSSLLFYDIESVRDRKSKIFYLPNGIPNSTSSSNTKLCVDSSRIRIVYLSNYVPSKGAMIALEAFNQVLKRTDKKITLEMYGAISNQSYFDSLVNFVNNNFLNDYVTLNKGIYGKEKIDVLHASDIFIFPTYFKNECFPISILEAMMCGLPIISTNVGAIPEIVKNNQCGLLSSPSDSISLVENLFSLVSNDSMRLEFSRNSYNAFNEKYTFGIFELSFVNILKTSLDEAN